VLVNKVWQDGHLTEQVLEEYALRRLGENETVMVEEHYLRCEHCQAALAQVDAEIHTMRAVLASRDPAPRTKTAVTGVAVALATAALVGVAILAAWRVDQLMPPVLVKLESFRGGGEVTTAHAAAGRALELTISAEDARAAGTYRIEVVTTSGNAVWSGVAESGPTNLVAKVPKGFKGGAYWVRLYAPDSTLVREFGLRLE
jgi:anti-sigma factor RsiW